MSDKAALQEVQDIKQQLEKAAVSDEAQAAEGMVAIESTSHLEDRDFMNQVFGQIQMGNAISNFTNVIGLSKLAEIKKTKQYRSLKGVKEPANKSAA